MGLKKKITIYTVYKNLNRIGVKVENENYELRNTESVHDFLTKQEAEASLKSKLETSLKIFHNELAQAKDDFIVEILSRQVAALESELLNFKQALEKGSL